MSAAAIQPLHQLAKVLIVDDHHLLLEALTFVLKSHYAMGAISSLAQLDAEIASFQPDVVVIDISMPDGDGIEACRRLGQAHPEMKLIFLSMHTGPELRRAAGAGAHGFVSKRAPADELLLAIDTVLAGEQYQSFIPGVTPAKASEMAAQNLTERQKQVLRLVSLGFSAKEIASDLNISVRTAEFHRGAIMQRLNMHSTALLTRYAVEVGLV